MDDVELDQGESSSEQEIVNLAPTNEELSEIQTKTGPVEIFDISEDSITPSREQEAPLPKKTPVQTISQPPIQEKVAPIFVKQPQNTESSEATNKQNIKNFRTYAGDVAHVLATKNTSTTTMVLAENKKKFGLGNIKQDIIPSTTVRNLTITLVSLLLLGGGGVGAYVLYLKSPLAPVTVAPQQQITPSLVPVDSKKVLAIDTLSAFEITTRIQQELSSATTPNTIKEIIFTKTIDTKQIKVPALDMIKIMDISAPDMLTRSLTPYWMLGIYTDKNGKESAFIVVTTNFFQNAFAGMLQWERLMADDLRQYLFAVAPKGITNGEKALSNTIPTNGKENQATSTTGTSTVNILEEKINPYPTASGVFSDGIIKSKDVRIFHTVDGKILFLYSFIDNFRLVIASNEEALQEILVRLEKQAFMR